MGMISRMMGKVASGLVSHGALVVISSAVVLGCQRQPTEPPEAGAAPAPIAETAPTEDPESYEWTEADERGDGETFESLDREAPVKSASNEPSAEPSKSTEVISFDEHEPNPGPTEMVGAQPERPSNGSLLTPDVLSGPKK